MKPNIGHFDGMPCTDSRCDVHSPERADRLAKQALDFRYAPPGHPAWRGDPDMPAAEWRDAYFALAKIALKQLDDLRADYLELQERFLQFGDDVGRHALVAARAATQTAETGPTPE